MYGFSFGCMSFVSANYGARKFDNIKKVVKISLILTFSVGIVMSMCLYALRYQILRLFAEDPHFVEAAATRMTYICRLYFN